MRPGLTESTDELGQRSIQLLGCWTLQALAPSLSELKRRIEGIQARGDTTWDLAAIDALDHAGAAFLWRTWGRRRASRLLLRPEHESLFRRLRPEEEPAVVHSRVDLARPLLAMGAWTLNGLEHARDLIVLIGFLLIDFYRMLIRPSRAPWREISANIYRTGAQALGITALVGFLIGVVLSFLSANQLKLFGADIFIVNILGVSIIRELGPVLAAILVAGRSGSSMTAQLGVMRVTQELDALSVMGIPHMSRLILPKVLALALGLPLIILWTNAVALLGGMVAARAELGLSYLFFIDALPGAVPIANLWLGIGKGAVFGVLIALLACHYGLRIRPNTESLGAGTTSSVVTAITIVILVDAVFAILFRDVGMGF